MIEPQGELYIHQPNWYKVDVEKLHYERMEDVAYLFATMIVADDYEYFDKVKKFLIIPEPPKTLDEITQELDEKFEKLIEQYKRNSYASKLTAERNYENKFDKIFDNFAYAKEHGEFRPKLKLSYTATGLSAGSYETSFVIKQGKNHKGYYTFGNQRYFKYYMPEKPTGIVRFFMKVCLGFFWVVDEVL